YMHFRYYGSNIGRFMKPDPVGGNPGNPQSWNLYAYVGNNPINRTDPTGMYWMEFHYYATYYAVMETMLQKGYNIYDACCTANTVATASALVDINQPARFGGDKVDFNLHFITLESADILMDEALASGDENYLGFSSHSLEDSFPHAGGKYPFGHASKGTRPDDPRANPNMALAMIKALIRKLGGDPSKIPDNYLLLILTESKSKEELLAEMQRLIVDVQKENTPDGQQPPPPPQPPVRSNGHSDSSSTYRRLYGGDMKSR
ncbi:MAG TPA: RHS repeat-associated core domain-containing protein, partial [Acidobacteriota bacterium]|nr:RHS repeat-associated core domain-containing protein [Acidobacteriota bacterium]